MNIKTIRQLLKIAQYTTLTPHILTNGEKDHNNVEGIIATVLKFTPSGPNCMVSNNGLKKRQGTLQSQDYDKAGLPQMFSSSYVWGCAGISQMARNYFTGFDAVSWLTLDMLPYADLLKVLRYILEIEEISFIRTLETFTQLTKDGDPTPFLNNLHNGKSRSVEDALTSSVIPPCALREIGLRPIYPLDIYLNRHRLELSIEQKDSIVNPVDPYVHTVPIHSLSLLHPTYLLSAEQISTLLQIISATGPYSPTSQSKYNYYLKELRDKSTIHPNSLTLNNGIIKLETYLNLPPSRPFIDPLQELDKLMNN